MPNRRFRAFGPPASPPAQNHERVGDYEQNSEDAPRASAANRPKPRKGRRLKTEFCGRSTRQRRRPPKTTKGSSIMDRILRTLHAPAPPSAQHHARVVDYEKNSEEAPRANAAARPTKSFKCYKHLYSRQIDAKRPRHGLRPPTPLLF